MISSSQRLRIFVGIILICVLAGIFFLEKKHSIFDQAKANQFSQVSQSAKTADEQKDSEPVVLEYPKVLSITPRDGTEDVAFDIEDPIIVRFDRPTTGFFIDFRLSPDTSVAYRNNEEKTEFQLLPAKPLQPDISAYTLDVFARRINEDDSAYRFLASSKFSLLPERPASWSKDVATRLAEAKKYTRPRMLSGKYIDINLSNQTMILFENGVMLDAYPVSSGKRGMDTPKGEFSIQNKALRPWSKRYSLYMPYWMAITPDGLFGIHELPEWPGGYKEGAAHLGIPVSHGCVRLGVGSAKRVYAWAEIGTTVVVH